MTTQEFVISEAEKYVDNSKPVENDECSWQVVDESFSDGLTKGLEIAIAFRDWPNAWEYDFMEQTEHTTSELLSIYLTEINEKK